MIEDHHCIDIASFTGLAPCVTSLQADENEPVSKVPVHLFCKQLKPLFHIDQNVQPPFEKFPGQHTKIGTERPKDGLNPSISIPVPLILNIC